MATMHGAEREWTARPNQTRRSRRDSHHRDVARSPAMLAEVIERQIIPRLLIAHRDDPLLQLPAAPIAAAIGAADVDALAPLVLELETCALMTHIEAIIGRGVPVKTVFVDLLAPVARRLGEYWDEDVCDFVAVTMGLWRLQEIVREISARSPVPARRGVAKTAVFAPMPGEQHSFGAVMVEELFRRSGWATECVQEGDGGELLALLAAQPFDMIGLTLTCETGVEVLPTFIGSIRRVSRNRAIVVMVGGRVFADDPELAIRVGADGTAPNANQAVGKATMLVEQVGRRLAA